MQADEFLNTLITRIKDGISKIHELWLVDIKNPYTIKNLNAELVCMTMIHSLCKEYPHFAFSLMLLKCLNKDELKAAFLAEKSK